MATEPRRLDRVAAAYDHWAGPYADLFADPARGHPWDRAAMTVLAETVRAGEPGPVVDLGCGPGHWTAYLAAAGLDVHGVDISADFVALARAAHPGLRFDHRSMTDTGLPDRSLRGAVAWFSLIHVEPAELPAVLVELRRMLADGAPLLVGFQTTDEPDGPPVPYDHRVAPAHRWPVGTLADLLAEAGFVESTRLVRQPEGTERCPQGALLVRAGQ
ncbi:class I SAM-dependent methyltransferase [Nocardioides sp. W7]|uniref:class I SAM-dependent DNA methyltransferase n=1 Tax=Nocardioides sp. W7 TaxID=2931390 RepID=UPI001FD2F39E|nr:class I SAM-dependent methyltransferase [Nocardioides sp. W7]